MEVQVIQKAIGRIDRITGTVIKERLKVAAYCRVSTDKEEQKTSYTSQLEYYRNKISDNINWKFVDIYADEAISGTQDYKRSDFMRMIHDALDGKIDLIMTKSISRFARNTIDTLKYVRMLKEKNIGILFEEENINTLEMAGELLLTILSSVAQQESENTSSHVTLGLEMKMKRGELVGFNKLFGYDYDKEKKSISINEKESQWVEYIFKRYCKGIGCKTIASELTDLKVTTPKGYEKWSDKTILGIIKNEKYKGDLLQEKTYTISPITHKRIINRGERDQYYVKNHHDAIISEDIWNQAQIILSNRSKVRNGGRMKGNYSRKYEFSSRIFCGFCGSVFTRRCWASGGKNEKKVWQCMQQVKNGIEVCSKCKGIGEDCLKKSFVDAYDLLSKNDNEIIEKFIQTVKEFVKDTSNETRIKQLKKKIDEIDKKMSMLIDLHLEGHIEEKIYFAKKEEIEKSKEKIQHELTLLEMNDKEDQSFQKGLVKIEQILKKNKILPEFDADVFESIVNKVIIGNDNDPLSICFVLKNGKEYKEDVEERHKNLLQNDSGIEYKEILNFYSNQNVTYFENKAIGKRKCMLDKINVKVVYAA